MTTDIVRTIPGPIGIQKWIQVWNTIPDTNHAKELFYDDRLNGRVQMYYGTNSNLFYNKTSNILTHMPKPGYKEIPWEDFQSMWEYRFEFKAKEKYVIEVNKELEKLRTACADLTRESDFIKHRGIKYGNTLENIRTLQKQIYNDIKRDLPKYIELPEKPFSEYNIKFVIKDLNYAAHSSDVFRWICVIQQYVDEHPVIEDEQIHKIELDRCKKCCTKCSFNLKICNYFEISGKSLINLINIVNYNKLVKENEEIRRLYKFAYAFTSPLSSIWHKGIQYGNPDLTMQF